MENENGVESARLYGMRLFIGAWMAAATSSAFILLMMGESGGLAFVIALGALVTVVGWLSKFFREMKR